jgi:CRISPR-associated protein (Cas_Cmr5)
MALNDTNGLARLRAAFAYNEVSGWAKFSWAENAAKLVKGLPVRLRTLGLPVVLATLMRNAEAHERELTHLLSRWLLEKAPHRPLAPWDSAKQEMDPAKQLLAACIYADRAAYMAAQTEALALLEYVKLFAEALNDSEKEAESVAGDNDSKQS